MVGSPVLNKFFSVIALFAILLATLIDLQPWVDHKYLRVGHADEAEIALLGRNIAEGKGAVVDCYWLLHGPGHKNDSIPRPEGYWSLYVGYWFSLFFKIFGAGRTAVLLAASVCKTATAVLVFAALRKLTGSSLSGLTGLCGVLFLPQMTGRINGFSDIELTLSMMVSTFLLVTAWNRPKFSLWALAGVFAGIATGVKPSGFISYGLMSAFCFYSIIFQKKSLKTGLTSFLCGSIGFVCGVLPLWIYNYQAAGSINLPDFSRVSTASAQIMIQGISPSQAFYDPELPTYASGFGTKAQLISWARNSLLYVLEYFHGDRIHPVILIPFIALGIARSKHLFTLGNTCVNTSFDPWILSCILLNVAGFLLSMFLPLEGRYWNFLVPINLLVAIYVMWSVHRLALGFGLIVILIIGMLNAISIVKVTSNGSEIAQKEKIYRVAFTEADEILPKDAIVMTPNPWEFSFHTRRKTVVVPYNSNPEVLRKIAARFSATHLAIINNDIRNPQLKKEITESSLDFLEKVYASKELVIWKFKLGDATSL